jgi:hypothetical protein
MHPLLQHQPVVNESLTGLSVPSQSHECAYVRDESEIFVDLCVVDPSEPLQDTAHSVEWCYRLYKACRDFWLTLVV